MADAPTYILKTVAFTPSGGSAQAIDGLDEITIRQGGEVVGHGTDGQITLTAHFLDNIEGEVSIRSRNAAHLIDADLQPGLVGSLVLTMQKRKGGKGAVSGQDKIITAAEAMISEVTAGIPGVGRSDLGITWKVCDAEGVTPFAYS